MEDGILKWLHHCYKVCCKKDGHHKVGLYGWEAISPWGCNFWIGRLAYDTCPEYEEWVDDWGKRNWAILNAKVLDWMFFTHPDQIMCVRKESMSEVDCCLSSPN